MAKKRSAIDCVLWVTAASSFFTQDGDAYATEKEFYVESESTPESPDEEEIIGQNIQNLEIISQTSQ